MFARDSEERGTIAGDGRPQATCVGVAVADRVDEPIGSGSPTDNHPSHTGDDDNDKDDDHDGGNNSHKHNEDTDRNGSEEPNGRNGSSPQNGPTVGSGTRKKQIDDAPGVIAHSSGGAEDEKCCHSPTPEDEEEEGIENTLRRLREGPMRDVLTALLTSTVMTEDGRRVLAPTFPSISALRELKYCGPVEPLQASVFERVLFARYASFLQGGDMAFAAAGCVDTLVGRV